MTRWRGLSLAVFVVLLAGVASIPWLVPERVLRGAMLARLAVASGGTVSIDGPVRIALLPTPAVTAENVRVELADASAPLLVAEKVEGSLYLPSLFLGRFETGSVTIDKARIFVGLDGTGRPNWMGLQPDAAARSPGRVRFTNSLLTWSTRSEPGLRALSLTDITLDWMAPAAPLAVSGVFSWRDKPVQLSLQAERPAALAGDGSSALRLTATSEQLSVAVAGTLTNSGGMRLDSDLDVRTSSLREALRWFGLALGDGSDGGSFGSAAIASKATIDPSGLSLTDVVVKLDGNEAEGALGVTLAGGRPMVTGTLAADSVDLTPYLGTVDSSARPQGPGWRDAPAHLDLLALCDLDVRLSANEAVLGHAKIGRTALSATIRDGALELTLGEAAVYGGKVVGQLKAVQTADAMQIDANAMFRDLDAAGIMAAFSSVPRVEGKASGSLEIRGAGPTARAIIASLAGQGHIASTDGVLVGIDLADALQRIRRRPLSATLAGRGGRTPFTSAAASFALAQGIARTGDILLEGPRVRVSLGGTADVSALSLNLNGTATLIEADATDPGFLLPFTVAGSWWRPVVEADAEALIEQSGAAAPLLRRVLKPAAAAEQPSAN